MLYRGNKWVAGRARQEPMMKLETQVDLSSYERINTTKIVDSNK